MRDGRTTDVLFELHSAIALVKPSAAEKDQCQRKGNSIRLVRSLVGILVPGAIACRSILIDIVRKEHSYFAV